MREREGVRAGTCDQSRLRRGQTSEAWVAVIRRTLCCRRPGMVRVCGRTKSWQLQATCARPKISSDFTPAPSMETPAVSGPPKAGAVLLRIVASRSVHHACRFLSIASRDNEAVYVCCNFEATISDSSTDAPLSHEP